MFDGPVIPATIRIGLPILIGNCAAFLYTIVDTIFISLIDRGSTELISGTGLVVPLYFLFFSLGSGIAVGVGALVARGTGSGDNAFVRSVAASGLLLAAGMSVVTLLAGFLFIDEIIRLLSGHRMSAQAMAYGAAYFRSSLPGLAILLLGQACLGVLQGEGKTLPIAVATGISTVVNSALAPVLIFGLHRGVGGAGLATSISIGIAAIYVVIVFLRGGASVPLFPGFSGVSARRIGTIISTGIPQTFGLMAMSVVGLVLNKIVGGIGQTEMNAWSLVARIDQMVSVPLLALAAATITLVGQNHGKGTISRIRRVNDANIAAAVVVMAALAAIYSILSPFIFGAFSSSTEVVRWSTAQVRVLSFTFAGSAAAAVAAATVLAVGKPVQALGLAAVRAGLLSLPLAWLLAVVLDWGMPGLFAAVGVGNLAGLPVGWIWSRKSIPGSS